MRRLLLILVVVLAVGSAVQLFALHQASPRDRWVAASHDRNAHYRSGLLLAADVRNGDIGRWFQHFDAVSWVWPPMNPLAVMAAALAAGPGPIGAALPGLVGFALTVVFAYLLAAQALGDNRGTPPHPLRALPGAASPSRGEVEIPPFPTSPLEGEVARSLGDPAGGGSTGSIPNRAVGDWWGPAAGFLAAVAVAVSPAHRAYATDVMLESMGAGLTLAALYAFVVWSQARTTKAAVWAGVAFTLLFLQKYNYWLMAVLAAVPVLLWERRTEALAFLRRLRTEAPWRAVFVAQLRRPLNTPIAAMVALSLVYAAVGEYRLGSVKVESIRIFVAVGYALVLLRWTIWWWLRGGRQAAAAWLPPDAISFYYWHVAPVLVWFALPYRLGTFFWFISPANTLHGESKTLGEGAGFYWAAAKAEYVPHPDVLPALAACVAMAALLVFVRGAYRRGGWVVPVAAAVSVFLTAKHPNHQPRFLHTALPVVYVAAAVGLVGVIALLARRRLGAILGGIVLGVAASALAILAGSNLGGRGHADGLGANTSGISLRDLTDPVADVVEPGEPTAIFTNTPGKFWSTWLYLERTPLVDRLHVDCKEIGVLDPPTAAQFAEWCGRTDSTRVIFVHVPRGSPYFEEGPDEGNTAILDFLPGSPFRLVRTVEVPGRASITVWKRP